MANPITESMESETPTYDKLARARVRGKCSLQSEGSDLEPSRVQDLSKRISHQCKYVSDVLTALEVAAQHR